LEVDVVQRLTLETHYYDHCHHRLRNEYIQFIDR
jgi:hypothetical protein